MNQILDYGAGNSDNYSGKSNNNYNGNNYNKGSNGEKSPISDKIIKVFAIFMIVLAVALIISGVTSIMKNKDEGANETNTIGKTPSNVTAEISAKLNEISGKVKITIDSPVAISKVIYSWGKDHENVLSGDGQTTFEVEVSAPLGENVLHVQVTDERDNKTMKDFTIDSPIGIDKTAPNIVLTITEDKKLLVTATDDTSIAYVTYSWTSEDGTTGDEITMTPEEEGLQEYEFEIDIPRGKNTIVVIAVDGSESFNSTTSSKVLEGVTLPEISYGFLDLDGKQIEFICTHESGIKKIFYTLNGQDYEWNAPEGEEVPEISFIVDSVEGENVIDLKVTSVEDTVAEFPANWVYQQEPINTPDDENNVENQDGETGDTEDLGSDETEENN